MNNSNRGVGPRGSFLQLQRLSSPPPDQLKRLQNAGKAYIEADRDAQEAEAAAVARASQMRKRVIWKGVVDDCADIDSMAKTTCKNKCRNEQQPSWCEDVVRRYCERDYGRKQVNQFHSEDPFCACYNSEVSRSSQSPEVKALVSCFDAKCVRDGYKNPTMWEHSEKCPNLCQQMIEIGAGRDVSIGDINLSQKCEEVTRSDTDVDVSDSTGTIIDEESTKLSEDIAGGVTKPTEPNVATDTSNGGGTTTTVTEKTETAETNEAGISQNVMIALVGGAAVLAVLAMNQ